MKTLIAIDIGRSSVKVRTPRGVSCFPFIFSRSRSAVSDTRGLMDKSELRWALVDGQEYLFGKTAQLLGNYVSENTEGQQFQEVSIKAMLYAVAEYFSLTGEAEGVADIAINLTFSNHSQKKSYQDKVIGTHTVLFKEPERSVTFSIDRCAILYQGYSGYFDVAMDTSGVVSQEYIKSSSMIVDIGRRTIDFLYITDLVVTDGKSDDFGTFKLYERVIEVLKRTHDIDKKPFEIDEYIADNKPIPQLGKPSIDVLKLAKAQAKGLGEELMFLTQSFLAKKTPERLILLGGGALLFEDILKKEFPTVIVPDNPQFCNVNGLYKFLCRVSKEE